MPTPPVDPWLLCIRLAPGQSRDITVTIAKVPTSADLKASVSEGSGVFAVKHIVVFDIIHRPLTEEEIAELPPVPPSIRKKARETGSVEEKIEIARSDGAIPMRVEAGKMAQIVVHASASAANSGTAITGTLRLEASEWDPVEVPWAVLVGQATHSPVLAPAEIRRAAEPGETVTQDAVIAAAPIAAKVVAFVEKAQTIARLAQVVAFRPFKKMFTEEEIEELPAYPPAIREQARQNGYVEYRELARGNGLIPISVSAGDMLRFYLELSAPAERFPDFIETDLVVEGTGWTQTKLPLQLIIGKVSVEVSRRSLDLRQGESGSFDVTLRSVAGPDTVVSLGFGEHADEWRIEPLFINLPKRASVQQTVSVQIEDSALLGTIDGSFEARCFQGLKLYRHPFRMVVRPGRVSVRLMQSAISLVQGQTVTCQAEVQCFGGHKAITLSPSNPPNGIRMNPRVRNISGKSTTLMSFDIVAPPDAVPGTGVLGVNWEASDGVHRGVLFLEVAVSLAPDSRTFHQQITTPSGTALGGWAEVTIRTDGTYRFHGHMHGSGLDPYAFRINAAVVSGTGIIRLAAQISGHVAGTVGPLFTSRDFDWDETGSNPLIVPNWAELRNGTATFGKWYSDTGVLGTLEEIAEALANFFVLKVFVGPLIAGAIVIGSELGATSNIPFLHPTVIAGVFVAGGLVLLLGPGVILPAIVAGIATANEVKARPLRESELALARKVFSDTIPFDRILITNFDRGGKRAFCAPSLDGSILICMGGRYDDTMTSLDDRTTLVHELTHAWQIVHNPVVDLIWQSAINETRDIADVYAAPEFDGREWGDFSNEQQAVIVASNWYNAASPTPGGLDGEVALTSPWFRYIKDNIRLGQS